MTKLLAPVAFLILSLLTSLVGQQPGTQTRPAPQQPIPKQAQEQNPGRDDEQDIVRITSNLVQLDVVVTKDGKLVTDLTADDFEIFEDGHPQQITNFSYVSNIQTAPTVASLPPNKSKSGPPVLPAVVRAQDIHRSIALVVDDMGISFQTMGQVRKQLRKFVDVEMQPNDLVAIIRTGGEVGALQQFTTDKRLLYSAIDFLRWNQCSRAGIAVFAPAGPGSGAENGVSACSEAARLKTVQALSFILRGMREMPGRKSMVVLSDTLVLENQQPESLERDPMSSQRNAPAGLRETASGMLFNYQQLFQNVAELAIRSSVVIYAVHTVGLMTTGPTAADDFSGGPGSDGRNSGSVGDRMRDVTNARANQLLDSGAGAELLTKKTGGFFIRNSNDFGLQRVMQDQEGYYLIGYRPREETFNRRFHSIKARVKRPGLIARTRSGFYGVTDKEARPPERTSWDRMNVALMSPFGAVDIDLRLSARFVNLASAGSIIRAAVYLNARDLTFTDEPEGWHKATIDLRTVIFGDNGSLAGENSRTDTLRLRGKTYERALRDGFVYQFHMPVAKQGAYQFRVAIRDATSSRIGTAGQFVEVPDLKKNRLALSGLTISGSSSSAPNEDPATTNDDGKLVGAAMRRFRQSSNLEFGYAVYDATLDKTTRQPQLTAQTNVFRDGKLIFASEPQPIDLTGQSDLKRIIAGGALRLGSELAPGEYILLIVVNDPLAKDKYRTATQWVDFEVVK